MRRLTFQRVATAALVGGITAVASTQMHLPALHATEGAARVEYGKTIPNFTLPNAATGKTTDFDALSAGKKATVVIFMSTNCPVSRAYEQRIESIATKYSDKGVQVLGVFPDVGEESGIVAEHAKQNGLTFPCLRDAQFTATDEFAAQCTPEVFVADSKGVLVYHGPVDDSKNATRVTHAFLGDALDAVLAGKTAPSATMRAFGCQIHRS